MSDSKDKPDFNDQTGMLNALESIKSLLEQSESKLTAARESISRANQPRTTTMSKKKLAARADAEPVVPVLDDIIELDIPELEPELNAEPDLFSDPTSTPQPQSDADIELLLDHLAQLQKSLEKHVRDALMRSVVNIEKEVKKTINEQFEQLRRQIVDKE